MEKAYRGLVYFIAALLAVIIAGFYKTYFGLFPQFDASTTWLIHIHMLLLMSWIVLLIVQPVLIRRGMYGAHRVLGKISYPLFVLIVLSMMGVMKKEYDEGVQQKMLLSVNLEEIFLSFSQMLMFILFYLLAIRHKKFIPYHMRYMIGTAFVMIGPGLARLVSEFTGSFLLPLFVSYAVTDLPLVYFISIERKKSRRYQPYVVILTSFLIYQTAFLYFYFTNIQYHS